MMSQSVERETELDLNWQLSLFWVNVHGNLLVPAFAVVSQLFCLLVSGYQLRDGKSPPPTVDNERFLLRTDRCENTYLEAGGALPQRTRFQLLLTAVISKRFRA